MAENITKFHVIEDRGSAIDYALAEEFQRVQDPEVFLEGHGLGYHAQMEHPELGPAGAVEHVTKPSFRIGHLRLFIGKSVRFMNLDPDLVSGIQMGALRAEFDLMETETGEEAK